MNFLVAGWMDEIGKGIQRFVVCAAFLQFFLNDFKIAQAGDARRRHDHRFGPSINQRHHVLLENPQHHFGFVLNQPFVLKGKVLQRFGHNTLGVKLVLARNRNNRTVQLIQRLERDNACSHIHDIAFGNCFGFGIDIGRIAKQRDRGRGRGSCESDKQLIAVVDANDFGEFIFRICDIFCRIGCIRFIRLPERRFDCFAHAAVLRAMGFVNQERDPQFLQLRPVF